MITLEQNYRKGFGMMFIYIITLLVIAIPAVADDDIEVEGIVEAVSTDNLTVQGIVFYVDGNTEIENDEGDEIDLSDIMVGDYAEVEAELQADSTYLATEIEIEDHQSGDEIEVEGIISDLGSDFLIVAGTTFFVDANTEIKDDDDGDIPFSDLMVGDEVEVEAIRQADSTYLALEIERENDTNQDEVEVTAPIDSIFADSLLIGGIQFYVDANTRIEDDDDNPIAFSELQVGMLVEAEGHLQNDGNVLAKKIEVEDFFNDELEVKGPIDSLATDYLVVLGTRFNVDASTVVLDDDNMPIPYQSLTVGLVVEVRADLQANGDWLATRIKIEDDENNDLEIKAVIDQLNGSTLEAGGRLYLTDGNTMVLDNFNNPIDFADLQVGMLVEIKAIILVNGDLLATKIKIEDSPNFSTITGSVTNISSSQISINQPQFNITSATIVLDENYNIVPISNIVVGNTVTLWADNSGQPTAMQIRITSGSITGINNPEAGLIDLYELGQNYPNPFNPSTTIPLEIKQSGFVELTIYNLLGQKVRTLQSATLAAGSYRLNWDGLNDQGNAIAGGVYYYRLTIEGNTAASRKMIYLK